MHGIMNRRGIVYTMVTIGFGVILALSVCALSASLSNPSTLVKATGATNDVTVYVRVEGQSSTIWSGNVTLSGDFTVTAYNSGNTYTIAADCPLGALDVASKEAGFDYTVNDTWVFWDLYVDSIAGEDAYGWYGWSFRINHVLPFDYGSAYSWHASGSELSDGDEILWYWGTWGVLPLRISVDKTTAYMNEQFTVTVSTLDRDYWHFAGDPWPQINWVPLPNATVYVGDDNYTTDINGKVTMSIEKAGIYEIFAEKLGYIRSDRVKVTVVIPAIIDIEPETLNLKSKGVFTAFITLPEGYDVADIDISSVVCEGAPAIRGNIADGTLVVKFDREDLVGIETGNEVTFTMTGLLYDGTPFEGSDMIRVINPP